MKAFNRIKENLEPLSMHRKAIFRDKPKKQTKQQREDNYGRNGVSPHIYFPSCFAPLVHCLIKPDQPIITKPILDE
ncbi:MAG: hypothetical protein WCH99_12995 [Verrucomicrobiota bacterium]